MFLRGGTNPPNYRIDIQKSVIIDIHSTVCNQVAIIDITQINHPGIDIMMAIDRYYRYRVSDL